MVVEILVVGLTIYMALGKHRLSFNPSLVENETRTTFFPCDVSTGAELTRELGKLQRTPDIVLVAMPFHDCVHLSEEEAKTRMEDWLDAVLAYRKEGCWLLIPEFILQVWDAREDRHIEKAVNKLKAKNHPRIVWFKPRHFHLNRCSRIKEEGKRHLPARYDDDGHKKWRWETINRLRETMRKREGLAMSRSRKRRNRRRSLRNRRSEPAPGIEQLNFDF